MSGELPSVAVPRLFPNSTIVILGSGPSLVPDDICRCRHFPIIAVNDTYQLAPDAAAVYSSDAKWWKWHPDAAEHRGLKYTLQQTEYASVTTLRARRQTPIDPDPHYLATGGHSGYSAINLAVHFGGRKLVLLGYDFQPAEDGRHHFFGEHPDHTHVRYAQWLIHYQALPAQLIALGVTIVNASRRTRIPAEWIPHVPLDRALYPSATE